MSNPGTEVRDGEGSANGNDTDLYRCPAVRPPTRAQLKTIVDDLGFHYEDGVVEEYKVLIGESISAINDIDELEEPTLPTKYPRLPGAQPKRHENPYNAWSWRCDIQGAAEGKLAGKTVAIKDNTAVAGVPMMNGCYAMKGFTPDFDATVVTRILDAGGRIKGKTVCENLCKSGTSYTAAKGPVKNPYDITRSTGGSSSGSAVAVSVGDVDMAIGGDQGGSVRMPAAWTGIVGLKPTFGLVPFTGAMALEPCIDHLGPMARTVEDCALLLEVLAGYDNGLDHRQCPHMAVPAYSKELKGANVEGMRIGVLQEGFLATKADPAVSSLVRGVVSKLGEQGARISEVSVPLHLQGQTIIGCTVEGMCDTVVRHGGAGTGHNGFYPPGFVIQSGKMFSSSPNDISDHVKLMMLQGEYLRRNYRGQVYAKGRNLCISLRSAYDEVLKEVDVLALPTIPFTATKLLTKQDTLTEYHSRANAVGVNTCQFNLTGHPAISVNAGFLDGLPVGLMLVGRHFDDLTVLKVAQAVEKVRDAQK